MRVSISRAWSLSGMALALSLLATSNLGAQCPTGTSIANFRYVDATSTTPRQVTYAWDAPAGAAEGTIYEVMGSTSPDYCFPSSSYDVVEETTATLETVTLNTSGVVYQFYVRVKGCPQVSTPGTWVDDSFQVPPTAPVLAAVASASGQVDATSRRTTPERPSRSSSGPGPTGSSAPPTSTTTTTSAPRAARRPSRTRGWRRGPIPTGPGPSTRERRGGSTPRSSP
ncbi:MAG: hypothetical protein IPP07_03860 [Holophagales bacterium]|nr:hypothetical protein [Holophagales bacterium]